MLPPLEYLAWAIANYGQVRCDLASSGLAPLAPEALAEPAELLASATDPRAPRRWTEAIAARFGVDPACAVATLGTTHGLWAIYAALLSPGDDVVVESPAYEPLVRLAEGLGARVVPFARDLSRGAPVEPAAVAAAIGPRCKLVVLSNLHNPSGAYVDDATLAEVAALARARGARLVVDEVYRDLIDGRVDRGTTAFHAAPGIITTSSLTKVYGLGWARAGWVLAEPDVARRVFDATLHSTGGVSPALASLGLCAFARFARLRDASLAARADDEARAAQLEAFVDARPHLTWHGRRSARRSIFGFVSDARGVDLRPAIERAVREEQVIVAPGVFFGAPAGFRIRYGALAPSMFADGLARLGRVLDRDDEPSTLVRRAARGGPSRGP